MDLQQLVDNAIKAQRVDTMKNSPQLVISEILLKLEGLPNRNLLIFIDDKKHRPTGFGSWRGSYRELCIQYEFGGSYFYEPMKDDCERDPMFPRDHSFKCPCGGLPEHDSSLPKKPTAEDFYQILKSIQGNLFVGYKGGDFIMGKNTPVWVANNGQVNGFTGEVQGVVDITAKKDSVFIKTAKVES